MTAVAGGDARCGIGTRLRSAREKKGLTILQSAEKLHVDPKVLESLEAEDFAALGAPVYVRGHLRHYAELVGESSSELQQIYSDTIRTEQPDLTRVPKAQPMEDPGRFVGPAIVVLVVFAVAGSVWWVLSLSNGSPPAHVMAVRVSQDAAAQAAAAQSGSGAQDASGAETSSGTAGINGTVSDPGVAGGPGTAPSAAKAGAGAVAQNPEQQQRPAAQGKLPGMPAGYARPASGVPLVAGTRATSTGTNAAAVTTAAVAGAKPADAPPAAKPAEVTLKFSADSWAEVYDSAGERLFYDVGAADSVHTVKGAPPLRVMLGNAPGVTLEVNGRAAVLGPLVQPDGSAQFLINRSGSVVRAKPASNGG